MFRCVYLFLTDVWAGWWGPGPVWRAVLWDVSPQLSRSVTQTRREAAVSGVQHRWAVIYLKSDLFSALDHFLTVTQCPQSDIWLLFLFCGSFLWQNGKTTFYFLSYSVYNCMNRIDHRCISPQESTRVSTVSSRRAMCVAATSNTAASFTTRRASASTPSLCSTTRASAVRSTPASAAITAPVPSTRPPKVRLCSTTCLILIVETFYD